MKESPSQYVIQPMRDMLYVKLDGSWNAEQTLAFSADFKRQVNRYFAREWACIFNLKDMDLLIPESYQVHAFRALNTWSYIKGMQALVLLFSQSSRSQLLFEFEEILQDRQPYEKKVCQSEVEANQWLASLGFKEHEQGFRSDGVQRLQHSA